MWACVAALVLGSAGCTPPTPTSYASPSLPATQPVASGVAPSGPLSPAPSPLMYLDPEALPSVELEDEDATSICDPDASQVDADAGATVVGCYDGTLFGLRALRMSLDGVERIYLRRTPCARIPCTRDELSIVVVTGWAGDEAWSTTIDWTRSITVPQLDPSATWPSGTTNAAPPVERPQVPGAPRAIRDREPYPYCGEATEGGGPEVGACFRTLLLDGRPVEMLERSPVTGNLTVLRFAGRGLIIGFKETDNGWVRDGGSMVLGLDSSTWSYHNWLDAERVR